MIDPLLRPTFGATPGLDLEIYPPRVVNAAALQDVKAIFLSHEHSDHFDLESLAMLPKSIPIYIGPTIVWPVRKAILTLGFEPIEIEYQKQYEIGDLTVRFFPADPRTAFWESRVSQIYIEENRGKRGGIFVAVDALISKEYIHELRQGNLRAPSLVIVSNNSRVAPPGAFQSLENWGDTETRRLNKKGFVGVNVLISVLVAFLKDFPTEPPHIAMCGGGFIKRFENFSAFPFSDHDEMGALANQLSLDINVVGLRPGEIFALDHPKETGEASWISRNIADHDSLKRELRRFIQHPKILSAKSAVLSDYERKDVFLADVADAEGALAELTKSLLLSQTARKALDLQVYRDRPLDERRIVFCFRSEQLSMSRSYALDFISGSFEPVAHGSLTELSERYPFGVEIPLGDFLGIVRGHIQIWDVVGVSTRSWFVGSIFDGLIPFLYCYYGENGSPELFDQILTRKIDSMEVAK